MRNDRTGMDKVFRTHLLPVDITQHLNLVELVNASAT